MKIELHEVLIRDLVKGFSDNDESGIVGYGGQLSIRPPFQREFVYKDEQRNDVIRSIRRDFPLNVMYWSRSGDGSFELLDGQQRTLSICHYVDGRFSVDGAAFHNLRPDEQEQVLDYRLMVYFCDGKDSEKRDWFKIVNIAGEPLTEQELLNAIYVGPWTYAAKRHFSRSNCPAGGIAEKYLKGVPIRQDYLETALKWISDRDGCEVCDYMSRHQNDSSCIDLWTYFQNVMTWTTATFPHYRKEMKGLPWGIYFNKYGKELYDPVALDERIEELYEDDDIKTSGIWEYLLSGNEKHLHIRAFSARMRSIAYARQNGICPRCGLHFSVENMEADHITPWSKGGKTDSDNCQMLCVDCNRRKSNI